MIIEKKNNYKIFHCAPFNVYSGYLMLTLTRILHFSFTKQYDADGDTEQIN